RLAIVGSDAGAIERAPIVRHIVVRVLERPTKSRELQRRQLIATRRFDRLEVAGLWLLRRHHASPSEIFDDMSLDPVALAAKERDRFAALIRHFDIVDSGAARQAALVRDCG